jgi:Ran GTPase-activating protein (RanGAP) involved in mRNA processing and transport
MYLDTYNSTEVTSTFDDVLASYIMDARSLRELRFFRCTFTDDTLENLATGLVENKSIRTLNLISSKLGLHPEVALSKILHGCPKLTRLTLSSTRFRTTDGHLEAIVDAIVDAIADDKCNLRSLNISGNHWKIANGSIALTSMMSKLSKLTMTNCDISKDGIRAIGEAIGVSKTITHINLGYNGKFADEIEAFSMGLALNKSLRVLALKGCNIDMNGLLHLKGALVGKSALCELELSFNRVGDSGCQHVADILAGCPSLEILQLGWNKIGSAGVRTIAAALPLAKKLQQLMLYHVGRVVDDSSTASLFAAADGHPNLSRLCIAVRYDGFHIGELAKPMLERLKPGLVKF